MAGRRNKPFVLCCGEWSPPMRWPLFYFPEKRKTMKHFGWTEDDILYEDGDEDYDESTKSNGQSQYEDFDWNEEAEYENEIDF
jgi:hypothetical protein